MWNLYYIQCSGWSVSTSLSDIMVKRRIVDISDDVLEQILTHVKKSPFYSIQLKLDEYTDITSVPQLSVIIRYINNAAINNINQQNQY